MPANARRDAVFGFLEHRTREVDACHRTVTGIQRGVDAGADAHFQNAAAWLDAHPLDGLQPPFVERRSECKVVSPGQILVDLGDEVVLDDGNGQRTRPRVRSHEFVVLRRAGRLAEQAVEFEGQVAEEAGREGERRHP